MSIPTVGPTSNGASNYEHVPIKDVTDFHKYSDVDGTAQSQHHTLGANANQASPGNHSHDGGASQMLIFDNSAYVDIPSAQAINGQKTFNQPIVGSFDVVPINEQNMMDTKIADHAAATGGNKVTGGQVYVGPVAAGGFVNVIVYPGLTGIYSIVVTPVYSSRITASVQSMSGSSCDIQAGNNTGVTSASAILNWIAVGY